MKYPMIQKPPITVPATLLKPDVLTLITKNFWLNRNDKKYSREGKVLLLLIRVEKNNERRALLLMDTFVTLLHYRGHSIDRIYVTMGILIDGVEMPFDLRETTKRTQDKSGTYSRTEYSPTNIFILKIGRYYPIREWRDGKLKLKFQLTKILARLEMDAAVHKEQMERARHFRENYEK